MLWRETWRADPQAARIADRHYSRKTPGSAQFSPPGRCMILIRDDALWCTSWPLPAPAPAPDRPPIIRTRVVDCLRCGKPVRQIGIDMPAVTVNDWCCCEIRA